MECSAGDLTVGCLECLVRDVEMRFAMDVRRDAGEGRAGVFFARVFEGDFGGDAGGEDAG